MIGQEYHIRRYEVDENGYRKDFTLPTHNYMDILGPNSWSYSAHEEEMEITIHQPLGKISFSMEVGFIHVIFEEGKFTDEVADQIVAEIFGNLIEEGEFFRSN